MRVVHLLRRIKPVPRRGCKRRSIKRPAGRRGTAQIYFEIACDGGRQPLPFAFTKAYVPP
jgi:hypothetical protein